ncbi:MAG TPA: sigma factor-like helix-turn-helix DNA-binding protein [Rectinemataceae bacterium]|nr:sigma factor-like helix-turn-helix DNA-binding protein [Rectinemataceae bacterium]
MMENKLRVSGIIFACVFLMGYLINIPNVLSRGDGIWRALFLPNQLVTIASACLFLVSALVAKLKWLQPAIFLLSSPIAIIPEPWTIWGLGYFIMGVVLLERTGVFHKRRRLRVGLLVLYLFAMEVAAVFYMKRPAFDAVAPTFFISAFGLFLWFLYKDRLVVFLKEPKPRLSLAEKGLTHAERAYVLAVMEGRSAKEICVDYDVAESTVRNTLARACKKLEVEDSTGIAVLAATHEVVA